MPDIVTFRTMVNAFCQEGKITQAHDATNTMVQIGIKPNVVIHNILIDGHCLGCEMDEVDKVFDQ